MRLSFLCRHQLQSPEEQIRGAQRPGGCGRGLRLSQTLCSSGPLGYAPVEQWCHLVVFYRTTPLDVYIPLEGFPVTCLLSAPGSRQLKTVNIGNHSLDFHPSKI